MFLYYISPQNKLIVSLRAIVYFWIIPKTSDNILSCVYTDVELTWHLRSFVSRPNISPNKILFETTADLCQGWRVMRGGSPPPTPPPSLPSSGLFHFTPLLDLSGLISLAFRCLFAALESQEIDCCAWILPRSFILNARKKCRPPAYLFSHAGCAATHLDCTASFCWYLTSLRSRTFLPL